MGDETQAKKYKQEYETIVRNMADTVIVGARSRIEKNPRGYDSFDDALREASKRVVMESEAADNFDDPFEVLATSDKEPDGWWKLVDDEIKINEIPRVIMKRSLQLDVLEKAREISGTEAQEVEDEIEKVSKSIEEKFP